MKHPIRDLNNTTNYGYGSANGEGDGSGSGYGSGSGMDSEHNEVIRKDGL